MYSMRHTNAHAENRSFGTGSNYVTQPLADEQLRAANAWKIAYLQRLRKESTNEPYVNAYFQAWNLSAAQVFGGTNKP